MTALEFFPIINHQHSPGLPTIAYFSGAPGGSFNFEKWQMWRGIAEAAKEWGMNLLYVAGEKFETDPEAVLYQLINSHNTDGIILWNSFFGSRSKIEVVQKFIEAYRPLPIVSIEQELTGCSSLLIDNEQGMRDLLSHLVGVHHYRRIGFIGHREDQISQVREAVFRSILSGWGLYDHTLIGDLNDLEKGDFFIRRDFQAIVAISDWEAVLLMEKLRAYGKNIPEDVAVVGMNDGFDARGSLPPLSTIRIPFRSMGRRAVEMIFHQVHHDRTNSTPPLDRTWIPLQLILRRSCGCLEPMAEQAFIQQVPSLSLTSEPLPLSEFLPTYKATLIAELARGMGTSIEPLATTWAEKFFDVFISELYREQSHSQEKAPSKTYLRDLNQLLRNAIEEGSNVSRWHEAITSFRRFFLPYLQGETLAFAENLWQQARVLVGQSAVRSELHRHWETNQRSDILRALETALLTASTYESLLDSLSEGLRKLRISDFYLVLYQNPKFPSEMARLAFAYQNGHRVPISSEHEIFPAQQILPNYLLQFSGPACLVLESLHLGQDEHIGYIVFQTNPPEDASICDIYQALRIQLSSALKGIRLRQELQQAFTQAEEANKLKSHFLSMVSHELRTPLNLIVGLSEMALRQQPQGRKNSIEFQKKYLEQIYISGQHLDRLIRDVLDLANSQVGQMNLIRQPLEFVPVLNDVANMGEQLASQKNLVFRRNYPGVLPKIWGDKTRLRQILLNLISNAVKFTSHGEVVLSAHLVNDQIQVSIADSGLGIPAEDQDKIFDEFYQSTRSTIRGYGGIGLGLAITRRLVEMHGGEIGVTSGGTEGSGSCFWFTLPILIENGYTDDHLVIPSPDSVLVIKDPKNTTTSLIDQLSQHGFKVQTIEMDKRGKYLKRLTVAPPGAIILDLSPSSETGWQIIKYLKENPITQDIPVLFYSLIIEQEKGSVLELDFMEKPVKSDELVNALERFGLRGLPGSSSPIILVIDDDAGILDLHARLVKEKMDKSLVLTARNGVEGLELMRKHSPHLVLLDLMMPELDGMGVLKIMQEDHKLRNIPVIILSAQVLTEREISLLNQGVATVLNKGIFTPDEVFERIENVLARNKRLGSESQRLVQRGMGFIHEHYQEDISRGLIAQELCVNEQYLSRCFKNEIGIGPMAYLSRYRIEQAKKLLLEKEYLSVTQVAMHVGLSSQSYFSRIFQQETGVSPTEFRRGR